MVDKNRERLRQFDLDDNIAVLLAAPHKVFSELSRKKQLSTIDVARGLYALAVDILLHSPIRCSSLCNLELNTQLQTIRRGNAEVKHIVLERTKNGDPYEAALPADTLQLLACYMTMIRPAITGVESNWLFPNAHGAIRHPIAFSRGVEHFVEHETGLLMNTHLFRHLSVLLSRRFKPGDSETPRQLLGHRSSATTLRSYTVLDSVAASKRHDQLIATLRARRPLVMSATNRARKLS
jgi:integrase